MQLQGVSTAAVQRISVHRVSIHRAASAAVTVSAAAVVAIAQVYGHHSQDSPRCMQQLLLLSQGAAETLQHALLQVMGNSEATAAAAESAKSAAAVASVDARVVDSAEVSPVSSEDEGLPAASDAAAAARCSNKRKMVS